MCLIPVTKRLSAVVRCEEAVLRARLLVSEAHKGARLGGDTRGDGGGRPRPEPLQETAAQLPLAIHKPELLDHLSAVQARETRTAERRRQPR